MSEYPGELTKYSKKLSLRASSRYRNTAVYQDEGNLFFGSRRNLDIPNDARDVFFEVTVAFENRLDLISYKFYGNALLYWLIAEANEISDPFEEISAGTVLRIPTIQTYYSLYGTAI